MRGCRRVGLRADEGGEEEGEKDKGGKKGGVAPPEGSPSKEALDLGPLSVISRGVDHSRSSSESV